MTSTITFTQSSLFRYKLIFSVIFLAVYVNILSAEPTGDANFSDQHFTGSAPCADCHNELVDASNNDISIETAWSTSMMANSARDPYWRAKVASELFRNPTHKDEINDTCSRCHAPMANDAANKDGADILIFDDGLKTGFTNPQNNYFDHTMDGVSCTLCHQIEDLGLLGTPEGASGNYQIINYVNRDDRPAYAQYSGVNTGPMRNNVDFTPQLGTHTSTSEHCATCHDLKTDFLDANGNTASTTEASKFPEQMNYSEWLHSDYRSGGSLETQCQGCHMPRIEDSVEIANRGTQGVLRPDFALHNFFGANTVMLDILNTNRSALGVSATGFPQAILDNRAFLQDGGGIGIISASLTNSKLIANVRISNSAGHKFPTGYPSRRAYIHYKIQNEANTTVFESGILNANGSITGVALDADSTTYEPHYDTITQADQVQVYEPIMANTDGKVTHTLLRAASYLKDNRLLPIGFDKATAPSDVAVAGAALSDNDFMGGGDEISYQVDIAAELSSAAQNLTITSEFRFQTLSFGHLQDLFQDAAELPQVSDFQTYFNNANNIRDELVATSSKTVRINSDCSPAQAALADICLLNVLDDDGDTLPNDWELANGLDPQDPSDVLQDLDLDGFTNLSEFQNNTAANNPDDFPTIQSEDVLLTLEDPAILDSNQGVSNIRGWALAPDTIHYIQLFIDGDFISNIPFGGLRNDVAAAFPDYPMSAQSGFSMAYNYGQLSEAPHEVIVRAWSLEGKFKQLDHTTTTSRFNRDFQKEPPDLSDTVIKQGASSTSISLSNVNFEGELFDVILDWKKSSQKFEITDTEALGILKANSQNKADNLTSKNSAASSNNTIIAKVAAAEIITNVEDPVDGAIFSGISNIRGWAISTHEIDRIALYIDENFISNIPFGGLRNDVFSAYPDYPNSKNSGFSMAYNYAQLSVGNHKFKIRIYTDNAEFLDVENSVNVVKFSQNFITDPPDLDDAKFELNLIDGSFYVRGIKFGQESFDVLFIWNTSSQKFEMIDIQLIDS